MNGTNVEIQQEAYLTRNVNKKSSKSKLILKASKITISILVWGSLLYGGYFLANQYINETKDYINDKIAQIEKQNQKQMEVFNKLQIDLDEIYDELINIRGELLLIEEDLALTGETLNGTDKTKIALQERIDELNKQLNELQEAIKKLEDAAND
ncbi:hypothetical protein BHF71_07070 [Vulcanibacillus modesticaldus]|uniref:Uncharacterized protein n=1 Tax=Vulcanibacillus modesticaldus TaxID=337097 RepID=A0A1D2YW82_9BACI|nr:hypothetical protein [Vulcanibacillus modesticaldus]OEF99951.1 hypothetical protein BHF71_07070 [Vulcanibacillus modesticaldus]